MAGNRLRILHLITLVIVCTSIPLSAADNQDIAAKVDIVWVMISAFLVFMMQAGFMCLESGLSRAKNSINVSVKNLSDFMLGSILYWLIGFSFMFGSTYYGLIGKPGHIIGGLESPHLTSFFVFQIMFAATAATIDSGAIAERTRFSGYLILSGITTAFIYPVFGHWAWGGLIDPANAGWLQKMGFIDFAGSTVVHSIGGWIALAGIIVIGPRFGKFDENGKPKKIHAHSLRLAYLGTFLLFVGWFGFNAGSTLEVNEHIPRIILNTILSASCGGCGAMIVSYLFDQDRLPSADMIANGCIAGLVGITAGCADMNAYGAAITGIVSGIVGAAGIYFIERVLKLDDVVGAVAVHAFAGIWGTLAVALFITADNLAAIEMSRLHLLGVQATGVTAAFLWTFPIAYVCLTILYKLDLLRVPHRHEMIGLNVSEHGAHSSLLELTHSMEKIVSTGYIDESLKVEAEEGTEAGDVATQFNTMIDCLNHKHRIEADGLKTENSRISRVFGCYVSESVRDRVLNGRLKLGGETVDATILFCDIRNFTSISETMRAEEVVDMLNAFFNEMVDPITENGGTLDKFMGDALMAVFGPPHGNQDHADRALRAAEVLLKKIETFNEVRQMCGQIPLGIGIGISTGEVVAGNIGSSQRMDFTVVGDPVNTASRLEKITKKVDTRLLFSEYTREKIQGGTNVDYRKIGTISIRGKNVRVPIYTFQSELETTGPEMY